MAVYFVHGNRIISFLYRQADRCLYRYILPVVKYQVEPEQCIFKYVPAA